MNKKKQSHLHSELESLPLNKLYNSSNTEYFGFYAGLFSNFSEDYPNFANNFGIMFIDLAFYKWVYSILPPNSKFIVYTDEMSYIDEMSYVEEEPNIDFDIGFLSKKEIDELLRKSEEELLRKPKEKCTDYLYEAVKNHPYKPYYPPDIMF